MDFRFDLIRNSQFIPLIKLFENVRKKVFQDSEITSDSKKLANVICGICSFCWLPPSSVSLEGGAVAVSFDGGGEGVGDGGEV